MIHKAVFSGSISWHIVVCSDTVLTHANMHGMREARRVACRAHAACIEGILSLPRWSSALWYAECVFGTVKPSALIKPIPVCGAFRAH